MAKKCSVCNEDVTGKFLTLGEEVFHHACFKCDGCELPLDGAFKERDGKRLCKSCAPDVTCARCKEAITGGMIKSGELTYHTACFRCEVCSGEIDASAFFKKSGKTMCKTCAEKKDEPSRTCRNCKEDITRGTILFGNGADAFHESCFVCDECSCNLGTKFIFDEQTKTYRCSACEERTKSTCKKCQKPILSGRVLMGAGDDSFHEGCFVCAKCSCALEKKFVVSEQDSSYLCEACDKKGERNSEDGCSKQKEANALQLTCDCGNMFEEHIKLCGKCGAKRPETEEQVKDVALLHLANDVPEGSVFSPPPRIQNGGERCTIRLTIVSARGLRAADIGGKSDPYCICQVPDTNVKVQTKTKMMTLNPEWNQTFLIDNCTVDGVLLEFTLMDYDFGRDDDVLGTTELRAERLTDGSFEGDLEVHYTESEGAVQVCGSLRVKVLLEK